MKSLKLFSILSIFAFIFLSTGCDKEEYFKSESGIKSELKGVWNLLAIPKYDANGIAHIESWTFNDGTLTIKRNGAEFTGTYSISTSLTKVKIKVENVTVDPIIYNGSWQIVKLDGQFLIIANDHDGATGLTEYEFQKGS